MPIEQAVVGNRDAVSIVAVTADGRRAVSSSYDKTLKVWDLETGRVLRTLEGHTIRVEGVAVTADGRRAVFASYDKTLKVWDLETGSALRTLEGHTDGVTGVAVMADGRRAVSASYDKTLKVWDLETGRRVAKFPCDAAALCCAFSGALMIVAGDMAGQVHLLSLELGDKGGDSPARAAGARG
jgi:WD40 repeat protein